MKELKTETVNLVCKLFIVHKRFDVQSEVNILGVQYI